MKHVTLAELKPVLEEQDLRLTKHRYATASIDMVDLLYMIQPSDQASRFVKLYEDHPAFKTHCAGARHHHWWVGGLEEHVKEMIGIGFDLMELYPGDLTAFTKSDFIVVCFLHDFAKVWGYKPLTPEEKAKAPGKFYDKQVFRYHKNAFDLVDPETKTFLALMEHGIKLTELQASAVLFAEGGYADRNFKFGGLTHTSDTVNSHNPLAVLLHMADIYSAQVLGKSLAVEASSEKPTLASVAEVG